MEILNLYTSMLDAAHMSADENGVIYRQMKGLEDKKTPVLVTLVSGQKASMVLPIKQQTDTPGWNDRVVFHPLRENTQRGESVVMERFRLNMIDRINAAGMVMMVSLLRLAADASQQIGLTPDQLGYLALLPDADAKALKTFNELLLKCAVTDKPMWMYIKHNGVKDGVVYRRLSSVSAPMLEAIEGATDRKVKGTLLRVSDVPLFKTLYSLVFPQSKGTDFGFYSQGSNSVRAPTIDSFMKSVRCIAENINDLALLFDSAVPNLAVNTLVNMAWTEVFDDIDAYSPKILLIPAMPGNEGRVLNACVEAGKEALLPWEPSSAPPSGMSENSGYAAPTGRESRLNSAPTYPGRPVTRVTATTKSTSSSSGVNSGPYYEMLEREKRGDSRQSYDDRRYTDPGLANGYPPQDSYRGRESRYSERRDDRSYGGRGRDDRRDDRDNRRDDRRRDYR